MPCCAVLDPFAPLPLFLLMGGLLSGIRRWRVGPSPSPADQPYEVACSCGQVVSGARLPVYQVLRCTRCGEALFILPRSRLTPVRSSASGKPLTAGRARARWRPWALPLLAAAITVFALVLAYRFVLAPHVATRASPRDTAQAGVKVTGMAVAVSARLVAARAQMSRGNFRLALEELKVARTLGEQSSWPRAQRQEAAQLQRQAELMADLLSESLEEILGHAVGVQEKEWQADFQHRYRGKAFVFDLKVQAGPEGRYVHGWLLQVRAEPALLELSDLTMLHRLPLDQPQRLLFGARLAAVRRERDRGWVVRLEPDSGVLITDPGTAICCFVSAQAPEVQALLQRQAEWAVRSEP